MVPRSLASAKRGAARLGSIDRARAASSSDIDACRPAFAKFRNRKSRGRQGMLPACLLVCLPARLPVYPPACLPACLPACVRDTLSPPLLSIFPGAWRERARERRRLLGIPAARAHTYMYIEMYTRTQTHTRKCTTRTSWKISVCEFCAHAHIERGYLTQDDKHS